MNRSNGPSPGAAPGEQRNGRNVDCAQPERRTEEHSTGKHPQ